VKFRRIGSSLRPLALVLGAAMLAGLGGCARESGGPPSTGQPLASCGAGIPAVKCNPQLYSPPLSAQASPAPVPSGSADEPPMVACKPGFFDSAASGDLARQFGSLDCFTFANTASWVVVSDGMSQSTGLASPGGSVVAVENCAKTEATCLDPLVVHQFGDFTVYFPPNPSSGRSNLQATFSGRFLWISVANCGLFTFDITTGAWYGHDDATMASLINGTGTPSSVKAPASVSGSDALANLAPPSTAACQQ
jgi:hypothetical protein